MTINHEAALTEGILNGHIPRPRGEKRSVAPALLVAALAALMILFALAGCGGPQAGTIVEKVYTAESTTTALIPWVGPDGTVLFIPQTHTVPCEYGFRVKDGDRVGYVRVSGSIWGHFDVGDYFTF